MRFNCARSVYGHVYIQSDSKTQLLLIPLPLSTGVGNTSREIFQPEDQNVLSENFADDEYVRLKGPLISARAKTDGSVDTDAAENQLSAIPVGAANALIDASATASVVKMIASRQPAGRRRQAEADTLGARLPAQITLLRVTVALTL